MSLSTDSASLANSLDTLNSIFPPANKQKFLRFGLQGENTALIEVADTAAIFQVTPAEILPVPQMSSCVLGIYNWRSEMLWTIDLAHLLGSPLLFASNNAAASNAMVVVIEVDNQYLGLVVAEVIDIEWYDLAEIQTPSAKLFTPELLPFMQGYISDGSIVLDPMAIAQSPLLQLS